MAAFLIPVGMSSLRGLTHVLTCSDEVATPFTVIFGDGEPIVLSSTALVAGEPPGLCGGVGVDIQASAGADDHALLALTIDNSTEFPWRGTVNIALGDGGVVSDLLIPVPIGRVEAGGTATETLLVRLGEGAHEIDGSLLIGP